MDSKLCLFLIAVCASACLGDVRDSMVRIKEKIVSRRNKEPPLEHPGKLIKVGINVFPDVILGLNSAEQTLTMTGIVSVGWADPNQKWNETLHEDISSLRIDKGKIWTPRITMLNGVDALDILSDREFQIEVYSNGNLYISIADKWTVTCAIDAFHFPFDEQECKMIFFATDVHEEVSAQVSSQFNIGSVLMKDAEWQVVKMARQDMEIVKTDKNNFKYNVTAVTFTLKRRSQFYVTSIIVPMGLTSAMNAVVFLVPASSGERVSFLVSIFVSHAVFLNFIYDIMPRSSERIPKMTIYLVCVLIQSCFALVVSAVSLRAQSHVGIHLLAKKQSSDNIVKGQSRHLTAVTRFDFLCFLGFLVIAVLNLVAVLI